jgi:hypothetical protein
MDEPPPERCGYTYPSDYEIGSDPGHENSCYPEAGRAQDSSDRAEPESDGEDDPEVRAVGRFTSRCALAGLGRIGEISSVAEKYKYY